MKRHDRNAPFAEHTVRAKSRGFTLIEAMAALALMSIFALLIGSLTSWQMNSYVKASKSLKTRDMARGVIAMLRDDAHLAGYGFALDANAYGYVPTGDCTIENAAHVEADYMLTCTKRNENNLSDRMRFMFGETKDLYINSAASPSRGPCLGGTVVGGSGSLLISQNDLFLLGDKKYPTSGCYLIGGACETGSDASYSTMTLCTETTDSYYRKNSDGCAWVIDVYKSNWSPSPSIGCTTGWKAGYSLSFQNVAAYFVKQDVPADRFNLHRQDGFRDIVIAKNVSEFKVTYGLDLSIPMDGKLDRCPDCADDPTSGLFDTNLSWCRDLNSRCNMKLSDGSPLTADTAYNRIVAVHVSFLLFDKTPADGERFQATFSLKNRLAP